MMKRGYWAGQKSLQHYDGVQKDGIVPEAKDMADQCSGALNKCEKGHS